MAEVHALRDDAASGRVRHVLFLLSVRRHPTRQRAAGGPPFFVVAGATFRPLWRKKAAAYPASVAGRSMSADEASVVSQVARVACARHACGCVRAFARAASASAAPGDPAQGEKLAKRWCAGCHVVGADQTRGADNVPPFATIAKMPGFNAETIAQFLMDPHPKMPDMQLSARRSQGPRRLYRQSRLGRRALIEHPLPVGRIEREGGDGDLEAPSFGVDHRYSPTISPLGVVSGQPDV